MITVCIIQTSFHQGFRSKISAKTFFVAHLSSLIVLTVGYNPIALLGRLQPTGVEFINAYTINTGMMINGPETAIQKSLFY